MSGGVHQSVLASSGGSGIVEFYGEAEVHRISIASASRLLVTYSIPPGASQACQSDLVPYG